jgi:hypothetical protein
MCLKKRQVGVQYVVILNGGNNMQLENKPKSKLLIIKLLAIKLSHSQSIFCCETHLKHSRL